MPATLTVELVDTYLASYTAWDAEPVLTDEQKDTLRGAARSIDSNGVAPGGAGYIESYSWFSLYTAVAQGCDMKAAAAAELHEGDEKVIYDHWKAEAEKWRARADGLADQTGTAVSGSSQGSRSIPNRPVW